MFTRVFPGRPYPLGATWDGIGVNFALFSENATKVELCLFDSAQAPVEFLRIALPSLTNQIWHCYLPVSYTAIESTANMRRRKATGSIRTRFCSTPTRKPSAATCAGMMRSTAITAVRGPMPISMNVTALRSHRSPV